MPLQGDGCDSLDAIYFLLRILLCLSEKVPNHDPENHEPASPTAERAPKWPMPKVAGGHLC